MKSSVHFVAQYIDFAISAGVATIIFLLVAAAFRLEIISINPGPIIIILLVWVNTSISLSFAISTLFGNARNALIGTFIILLMSIFISIAAVAIWDIDPPAPYFIWPPFACYAAIGVVNARAVSLDAPALTVRTMGSEHRLVTPLAYLCVEWFLLCLLAIYGQAWPCKICSNCFFSLSSRQNTD